MEKYLNTSIKEIITNFPEVGRILEEYNIGCVPCSLGSCLLKDIVAIHNLSEDDEAELMYRIEKTIYPERDVNPVREHDSSLTVGVDGGFEPPLTLCGDNRRLKSAAFSNGVKKIVMERKGKIGSTKEIKYSPPLKRLVDEHVLIKRWIAFIPVVLDSVDLGSKEGKALISDGLDFIRYYADKFHHAKEEDILFDYTDKNLDIIKTMLADHQTGRGHVKAMLEALKTNDKKIIVEHLNAYKDLLTEHIKKEDEILYPWIDRGLETRQVGELFSKFDEAEAKIDREVIRKCEKFAEEVGQRIERLKNPSTGMTR